VNGIYKYLSAFFAIGVVVQIGLAGYGAFYAAHKSDDNTPKVITHDSFEHGFGPHGIFGTLLVLIGILLFIVAAAGRLGRRRITFTAILAGLLVLQLVLAGIGASVPAVGILHGINALAILGLGAMLAMDAWGRGHGAPPAAV
jgi:hypothetical protein